MRFFVLAAVAASLAVPAGAADFNPPLESLITGFVRPAASGFAETAASLPAAVTAICQDHNAATATDLAQSFSATVEDFSRLHFLRFGPLLTDDRINRLAFMPDTRGTAQRQIRKFYASGEAEAITADTLKDKSVALQGLTAFQLVAFSKTGAPVLGAQGKHKDQTCAYALAIAENVAGIAQAVSLDWSDPDGYSALLLSAGPDNERFRTSKEAIEFVFNSLVTGLIIARDQDILPALGTSRDKAKPRRFPFSRSGNSIRFLSGELSGIHDAVSSLELKDMTPDEFKWIFGTLSFELGNAQTLLGKLQPPLRKTFLEGEAYEQVSVLAITLQSVRDTLALELAGALDLAGGFNALDGD